MGICILSSRDGKSTWCNYHQMHHDGHYRAYSQDPGPKGDKFRALWDKMASGNHKPPSVAQKIGNYALSLVHHARAGFPVVDDAERNRRAARCEPCKYNKNGACQLCGCSLTGTIIGDKLRWADSNCWNWNRYGVAIGCYNLPKLAELHILSIGDLCGPTPILICDDSVPGSDKQKAHEQLAKKYPHVTYWPNPENYGHHRGDATVFWKAIQWGDANKLDAVCKLSIRHLVTRRNWLKESMELFMASGEATGAVNCIDNDTRLFIRSEAVLLNVRQWFDTGAWKELQGRNSYAPVVELHYNHIMCKYFGEMDWQDEKGAARIGRRWMWPLLKERRYERQDGILWHCANTDGEYHDFAKQYGIELDSDFHTNGSDKRTGYTKSYKIG